MPDYYTSQFSGEEIDEALRSAKTITDAASGDEISSSVKWRCNPNLLDNWYFGRLVNQRGQTSYTAAGYTVDRWILRGGTCQLTDDGFLITASGPGQVFAERFEPKTQTALAGKTVTFSVLATIKSGAFNLTDEERFAVTHADVAMQTGVSSWTFTVADNTSLTPALGWWGDAANAQILVHAAKLELGDTQTLAHKEDGVWVLNEIPDYGEQLARCQRHDYFIGSADIACPVCTGYAYSTTSVLAVIDLPVYMRANPALAITGSVTLRFAKNQTITTASVANYGFSGDKIQLYFDGLSGLTAGSPCDIYINAGSKFEVNSNL